MENKRISDIDTSHKDFAMDAIQAKKEMYEKMKQEALEAEQASNIFFQQMKKDFMEQKNVDNIIPDGCYINEFGEIERTGKSR